MTRSNKPFLVSWIPALLCMGALFYASSLPGDEIHLPEFRFNDKVFHALAYSGFGLAISIRFFLRRRLGGAEAIPGGIDWAGMAVGMLWGVSDEIHQLFVPLREFAFSDMAADFTGIALACWLFRKAFRNPGVAAAQAPASSA
jgi:VanZ family protein